MKKKTRSPETSLALEMEGSIHVIEKDRKTGKVISREELEPALVLGALVAALRQQIERDLLTSNRRKTKGPTRSLIRP